MKRTALLAITFSIVFASPVLAHAGHDMQSGFLHPLTGLDHLLAMLAVGAWGAMLGGRAIWAVPASFMTAMLLGAVAASGGAAIPLAEVMIATSAVLLGALLLLRTRMPLLPAMALVAVFAVFHGYVHAIEAVNEADLLTYASGFMAATALLHALGAAVALLGLSRRSSP